MKHAKNLDLLTLHPIGHDERAVGDHEFTSAAPATRSSKMRKIL